MVSTSRRSAQGGSASRRKLNKIIKPNDERDDGNTEEFNGEENGIDTGQDTEKIIEQSSEELNNTMRAENTDDESVNNEEIGGAHDNINDISNAHVVNEVIHDVERGRDNDSMQLIDSQSQRDDPHWRRPELNRKR